MCIRDRAYTAGHVATDLALFRRRVGQYVFISSASAYQKPPQRLPITEETPLENPFWEYYRNKIACEVALMAAPVSYTHLRAHETPEHIVCRLLPEKKKKHT